MYKRQVVTIEARVKRTNNGGNANQFGMYSYNESDWKASDPAGSSNPMATFAFSKGNILSHNKPGSSSTVNAQKYELDQWYIVRNVVNLDTGTYDLYIDDMDTPVLENQNLRTAKSEINRFLFFENSSNTGDICVDYFRVCVGEPFDYSDAELIDLKVDGIELQKTDELTYEGKTGAQTESVMVTPTAGSRFAHVTVNGVEYNGTDAVEAALVDGENLIPVVVTAEDGQTIKEYTLKIVREDSGTLAYLTSLAIQGVSISPEFSSDVTEYTASVGADVEKIHLELTPVTGASVSMTVNGVGQAASTEAVLKEGQNIIEIEVGSQDGTNFTTYTLTVTKEESQSGGDSEEPGDGGQEPDIPDDGGDDDNSGSQSGSGEESGQPGETVRPGGIAQPSGTAQPGGTPQDHKAVRTGDTGDVKLPLLMGAAAAMAGIASVTARRKKLK